MSFLRSLFSGVSGMSSNQLMMDVIGNNVANVNSIAFKAGRATFSEMFAQTLQGATQPTAQKGGIDPIQVGLGTTVNSIGTNFSQGNVETTGVSTDLAIQGPGFFAVSIGGKTSYTRVGSFTIDAQGRLVNAGTGAILQGKIADTTGNLPAGTMIQDLKLVLDKRSPAKATSQVKFAGNLNSAAATGDSYNASVTTYDSLGNQQTLTVTFTKTATANQWTWSASVPAPSSIASGGSGTVAFNTDGTLNSFAYAGGATAITINSGNGASTQAIAIDAGTTGAFAGITQSQGTSDVSPLSQDGYGAGSLSGLSIDNNGRIVGSFTNSTVMAMGQVMLVQFTNPSGLVRTGSNFYDVTGNSGTPTVVTPGGSQSSLVAGALEQSNVDLANEFTKMIVAQRGFQSNARVITTSDQILNEVVNLIR